MKRPDESSPESAVCQQVQAHVYPFLDGELTPQAEVAIRCHLSSCDRCQEYFDQERRYLEALHSALRCRPSAPLDLKIRVLRLLRHLDGDNSV